MYFYGTPVTFVANNFYIMYKHALTSGGKFLMTAGVAVALTVLSSCSGTTEQGENDNKEMQTHSMSMDSDHMDGDHMDGGHAMMAGSGKCIDNKPAPTPFSNTLNAIDHNITLENAVNMINNFGAVRTSMVSSPYNANTLPVYETFNLDAIDQLICQDNAIGFRVYMAMDDQQQVRFVLVGVDGDGKDIIQRTNEDPTVTHDAATHSLKIMEAGQRWP